ncbi:hypothetical protein HZS_3565 [Henneguya salminicola]|nr:hypothetical protein HZS_3565 [Henneguya salminicola]
MSKKATYIENIDTSAILEESTPWVELIKDMKINKKTIDDIEDDYLQESVVLHKIIKKNKKLMRDIKSIETEKEIIDSAKELLRKKATKSSQRKSDKNKPYKIIRF